MTENGLYVIYARCTRVARRLLALGYPEVRILKGGLGGWTQAGLPLESKPLGDCTDCL